MLHASPQGFLRVLGTLGIAAAALASTSCDSFPDNPGVSQIQGQLAVVYQICDPEEVLSIKVIDQSEKEPQVVWSGVPLPAHRKDEIWVLDQDSNVWLPATQQFQLPSEERALSVVVETTEGVFRTPFTLKRIKEGLVRDDGKYRTITDFLSRRSVCPD